MQKRCSKQQVAKFGEEKTIQRGKLRKVWPEQQVVRNNNVQMCCLERQIAKSYPQQQPKK